MNLDYPRFVARTHNLPRIQKTEEFGTETSDAVNDLLFADISVRHLGTHRWEGQRCFLVEAGSEKTILGSPHSRSCLLV